MMRVNGMKIASAEHGRDEAALLLEGNWVRTVKRALILLGDPSFLD